MKAIHMAGYYPPPPQGERPPVHVEINFDEEPDVDPPIPQWLFSITVTFTDGTTRGVSGTLEAADKHDAELRVYSRAIDTLAELLAEARAEKR